MTKRVRFFSGQLLSAGDLQAEQDYVRDRLRRHNRWPHGWGVVGGLAVSVGREGIVVKPGLARIVLARLLLSRRGWRVDPRYRARRARAPRAPSP